MDGHPESGEGPQTGNLLGFLESRVVLVKQMPLSKLETID